MQVRLTKLLSSIFFFSGFAALMYQVAWQRALTLYYGVGAISITLIVSVYMFGLGIGSLFGGYLSERVKNSVFLYFLVEVLIGVFGITSIPFLDYLGRHTAGSSYLLSFFYMFLFLSIPTILMGITLPLLTKIFNNLVKNFLDTVSLLYFINTIGAAIGAVFTSYVIISFWGLDSAVYFAVMINIVLAALIYLSKYLLGTQPTQGEEDMVYSGGNSESFFGNVAYFLVFITGFLAIGYEIVWFRIMGVLLKASPYSFSSVLAVYLLGIALGSYGMSRFLKKHKMPGTKSLFFSIQFLISFFVLAIFIGYYYLTQYTPFASLTRISFGTQLHPFIAFPPLSSAKEFFKGVFTLTDVFIWPMVFVFIPTVLMGASFPLISSLAYSRSGKAGKTIGNIYFFNVTGNVLGGIVTGLVLLPLAGTEITLLFFSIVGLLFGLFVSKVKDRPLSLGKRVVLILLILVFSVILFPKKGQLYKAMHVSPGEEYTTYLEEGEDGIVMTYEYKDKIWNYINGLVHGGRPVYWYNYMMLESVTYMKDVKNVLDIGYGTGTTVENILKMKDVEKLTIVELNHALMKNLNKMALFRDMLADKRVSLVIDDGRRFLLNTDEKYDLIHVDAIRPTTSYSNNLYSREFFEIVESRLKPNGVFLLFKFEKNVIPKTIMSVFDYVRVYETFCLASNSPFTENQALRKQLYDAFSEREKESIPKWIAKETKSVQDNLNINNFAVGYPINQDWKPITEYYIGLTRESQSQDYR